MEAKDRSAGPNRFRAPLHLSDWLSVSPRLSRLHFGFLAQGYGQLVLIGVRLLEVPLFLHFWGAESYGEWLVITAIPSLLTFGDFGVSQGAVRSMTTATAARRTDEALAIYQSAALTTFVFSAAFTAIFLSLSMLSGAGTTIGLSSDTAAKLLPLLAVLAIYTMISMQSLLLFGVLQSMGKYPLGFVFLGTMRLVEFAASALVLFFGAGFFGVGSALAAAQVAGLVVLSIICATHAPWLKFGMRRISARSIRSLIKPSLAFAAFPAAQAMSFQALRLVIGGGLGPTAVVIFSTHRQLARFLNFITNFMLSVQGELGLCFGSGHLDRYRDLAVKMFRTSFALLSAGFVGLLIAAPWLYAHWTTGRVAYDGLLFPILLLSAFAEMLWRAAVAPAMAINRHEWVALAYLVIQAVAMISIIAIVGAGLSGIGLIICVAELSMLSVTLWEFRRITGVRLSALLMPGPSSRAKPI